MAINKVVCDRNLWLLRYTWFKNTDNTKSIIRTSLKVLNNIIFVFIILPHLPQQNCLKSECTFWWAFNVVAGPSLEAHTFTPLWWSTCLVRWTLRLNFFWQMSHVNQVPSLCDVHSNGFSPLWTLLCITRLPDWVNRLPQTVHSYGFSPLWILLCLQRSLISTVRWLLKSFATNSTFKRFLSTVNSAVLNKVRWISKSFTTNSAFIWFLSTVNSAVHFKVTWLCKSFATISTLKRFLSGMTSPMYCQLWTTFTAFATFCALVFTCMNIHMKTQVSWRRETLLTLITWIPASSNV